MEITKILNNECKKLIESGKIPKNRVISLKHNISELKSRELYYIHDSYRHPAKAHIGVVNWILDNYVKDGDTILDPMCGIGTTIIEGIRKYPSSLFIGIEIEPLFYNIARKNIVKTIKVFKNDMFFTELGGYEMYNNDFLKWEGRYLNKIIFSPPYGEPHSALKEKDYKRLDNYEKVNKQRIFYSVDNIIFSPPYGDTTI